MRLGLAGRALWSIAMVSGFCGALLLASAPAAAGGMVTNCGNDTQFSSRLAGGGTVTFNCGTGTILLHSAKTITQNTAIDGGGKITLNGGNALELFHVKGGVTLTLKNIVLKNGKSSGNGGAIDNDGTLVLNHVRVTHSAAPSNKGGGAIYNAGTLTAKHSTFDHNSAGDAGAILVFDGSHATISDSSFTFNGALGTDGSGGAISTGEGATVHLERSQLTFNLANGYGGAIQNSYQTTSITVTDSYFYRNQGDLDGGALYSEGTSTIKNSTFDTNASGKGGAVWSNGVVNATNVTLTGNAADVGGGLYILGSADLFNVTLAYNTAGPVNSTGTGGNIFEGHGGVVNMWSTLIADAFQSDNCTFHGSVASYFGLSTDSTCHLGTGRDNVTVTLGDLATNGGPVPTLRLPKGSLAIDRGDTGAACPATDARGVTRPKGSGCDVGAFEYQPCTGKPAAPNAMAVDQGAPDPSFRNVSLDWVGADCTTTYNVVVRYNSPTGTVYYSKKNLPESSATTLLPTGYRWYWRAKACNAKGCVAGPWQRFRTTTN